VKIGDWTGIQAALERFFEEVRRLIEVDLAAGSLLYRDSSAAVFSFPGEREDENVPAPWLSGWKEWLQEQIDEIAKQLDLETPPEVRLSQPTRSLVPMVGERAEAVKSTMVPVHRAWSICWKIPEESRGHVCPVCGVRRNGDPTSKGKPCAGVLGLVAVIGATTGSPAAWVTTPSGLKKPPTPMGAWPCSRSPLTWSHGSNGERVDSLRVQAISEWRRFNPTLEVRWTRTS
jgi:hypothetical protein